MYRILIVEDDPDLLELLDMNLQATGYATATAESGSQALQRIEEEGFDLALLDVMLPELDGFELLPYMKEKEIPVIYLSARGALADRVRGLKEGAEDYLVKPFEILELLVRMEKVLERQQKTGQIKIAGVEIREEEHTVLKDGKEIFLKPLEYSLMLMFAKHPRMVLSREQLLREVWGEDFFGETRTVDVHVGILRKKLGWNEQIVTVHRIGYKLEA